MDYEKKYLELVDKYAELAVKYANCVDKLIEKSDERNSLFQLFLDPENQPTQYGTVLISTTAPTA
jgi:hypothetical protein